MSRPITTLIPKSVAQPPVAEQPAVKTEETVNPVSTPAQAPVEKPQPTVEKPAPVVEKKPDTPASTAQVPKQAPPVVKPEKEPLIKKLKSFYKSGKEMFTDLVLDFIIFIVLLSLYLLNTIFLNLIKYPMLPKFLLSRVLVIFSRFYSVVIRRVEKNRGQSISRMDLIELSIKNMKAKKTRTFITVGGVSIGMGAIVFLVSLGYGIQRLVISRVARLDELRQADVSTQPGGKVKINDKTISDIKGFQDVSNILPLIAVVGRVNYQSSVSDMAVYGVTTEYLKQSAIKPVQGKVFDSNATSKPVSYGNGGQVAGAATQRTVATYGKDIGTVNFNIIPGEWVRVREKPDTSSKILGYTRRVEGDQSGTAVWGSTYISEDTKAGVAGTDDNGAKLGKWIKAKVFLWEEKSCDTKSIDCADGKHVVTKDTDKIQIQKEGYIAFINVSAQEEISNEPQVLGEQTSRTDESIDNLEGLVLADETVSETSQSTSDIDLLLLTGESSGSAGPQVKTVPLDSSSVKQAVVNRAMLSILGLKEEEAIGKKFNTTFIVTENLLDSKESKIESEPSDYTIVGVIPDDKTPVFYVPFIDLRTLGIVNYSQLKVVAKETSLLTKVRTQIESMGYTTQSVADTVEQINSLFGTVRVVLGAMGMIALAVAALGMFNTLTISLLERTREVGLMKAMGMKSMEIQELFMTESIIMGLAGGVFGLLTGVVMGKSLGLLLTGFALFKGIGFIDVSFVPFSFVVLIMVLSFLVGLVTGIFPSRRAKKISALNALRYE
jgi:ABC-type antimicrobial peptide transport system permease subunit